MHPTLTEALRARARKRARRGAWLRVLALTVALLLPTTPAAGVPSLAPALASELPAAEHDPLESAARPISRPAPPLRPAPAVPGRHHGPRPALASPSPHPAYAPHPLRSVVLRC
ncbi:hypothetical protein PV332_36105 [Streptomyces scabiei]|uniref:hypothetical protein n=1 Tax=Streptomyces scabiei TaxID=1930 RepID=UPI0011D2ADCD|nr:MULTISPECIES: hypothetical protein [Streptomyces]MBP5930347.1 hypothetical protein [Streptomyces sp. LBUM 1479]MBP5915787.1 hypothetical protein [Streptomyces sp. LBUM 1486]MDX2532967.1 hypothetical protein [Streptomyces scabiei]MDX2580862.1 hypothetical protein [Streptomyces scabiei]MDX2650763.1 hypothetical protein [Streptomyces scabiei]